MTEIARRVGSATSNVAQTLGRHGLEVRRYRRPRPPELHDAAWLREQYVDRRRSMEKIVRLLHVSPARVRAFVVYSLYEPPAAPEPEPVFDVPAHRRFLHAE